MAQITATTPALGVVSTATLVTPEGGKQQLYLSAYSDPSTDTLDAADEVLGIVSDNLRLTPSSSIIKEATQDGSEIAGVGATTYADINLIVVGKSSDASVNQLLLATDSENGGAARTLHANIKNWDGSIDKFTVTVSGGEAIGGRRSDADAIGRWAFTLSPSNVKREILTVA